MAHWLSHTFSHFHTHVRMHARTHTHTRLQHTQTKAVGKQAEYNHIQEKMHPRGISIKSFDAVETSTERQPNTIHHIIPYTEKQHHESMYNAVYPDFVAAPLLYI